MTGFSGGWFQRRKARKDAAERLYSGVMKAALQPAQFDEWGASDTFDGRAQMVTILTAIACKRLALIPGAHSAWLVDALNRLVLDGFDAAFREKGVGDSSIARKVRGLAETHSGLGRAIFEALGREDTTLQREQVHDILVRNAVIRDSKHDGLATEICAQSAILAAQDDESVLSGNLDWIDYKVTQRKT